MGRKSVQCPCGAEFPLPEIIPKALHCPKCGESPRFSSVDADGRVSVREDIREGSIPPLPVRKPYYPLLLLASAGLLIAVGLVSWIVLSSRRQVPRDPSSSDLVRPQARPRTDQAVAKARELPPLRAEPPSAPPPSPVDPTVERAPAAPPYAPFAPQPTPATESQPPATPPLPAPLLSDLTQQLAPRPAFYRRMMPDPDRSRPEALLKAGRGTGDDSQFLTGRVSELLRTAKAEQDSISMRVRDL